MHGKEDKDEELQSKKRQAARQESPVIAYTVIIKWTHQNATIYSCSPQAIPPSPNINQTNLPLQDWQHFAEEHEDSLIILELLRYGKKTPKSREIQWKEN